MKTIIFCGGKGTRLREETEYRPKPMVEIGNRPIMWYIMHRYASYGYKDFILPLGYKGDYIKQYFWEYKIRNTDFTIDLSSGDITEHTENATDWNITLCDTGLETMKGSRLHQVSKYIDSERFMVTYGDAVSDINIEELLAFHKKSGKIGTFTGVRMPSRFGSVKTDASGNIVSWEEKPTLESYINCGYFVFEREFLTYLSADPQCDLEKEPLIRLAQEGQLAMFPHTGFWHCMDTLRDYQSLHDLWESGKTPWMP